MENMFPALLVLQALLPCPNERIYCIRSFKVSSARACRCSIYRDVNETGRGRIRRMAGRGIPVDRCIRSLLLFHLQWLLGMDSNHHLQVMTLTSYRYSTKPFQKRAQPQVGRVIKLPQFAVYLQESRSIPPDLTHTHFRHDSRLGVWREITPRRSQHGQDDLHHFSNPLSFNWNILDLNQLSPRSAYFTLHTAAGMHRTLLFHEECRGAPV